MLRAYPLKINIEKAVKVLLNNVHQLQTAGKLTMHNEIEQQQKIADMMTNNTMDTLFFTFLDAVSYTHLRAHET